MYADVFEEYSEEMVKYIPVSSILVMDNASYLSQRVEKTPTSSWRKQEIVDWLASKDVPFQANIIKKELQSIANLFKHRFMKYAVKDIAERYNIIILHLPSYHCELNPIELIWVQVKRFVARRNVTFKMKDVELLFEQAIMEVTPENWRKCIQHIKEGKMWNLD